MAGSTLLGRPTRQTKQVVGQFTNNVFVPTQVDPDAIVLDTSAGLHRAMQSAEANVLPHTQVAAAVNPRFAQLRPWPDNHLFHSYLQAAQPPAAHEHLAGLLGVPVQELDLVTAGPSRCSTSSSTSSTARTS